MENVNSNADPTMNQRDLSKEFNQLRPTSLRSSGTELDPCCGGEIPQASGGQGLDRTIRLVDGASQVGPPSSPTTSRTESHRAAAQTNTPPVPITKEGSEEAKKLGAGYSSWKGTKILNAAGNPLHNSMDKVFRR